MTYSYTAPGSLTGAPRPPGYNIGLNWTASLELNLSLLMHFDGSNGSTTFTDSSPNNFSFTLNGALGAISTAQQKFGTASYLPSTNSVTFPEYITTTVVQNGPLDLGSGTQDFCIDFWYYVPTGATQSQYMIDGFTSLGTNGFLLTVDPTTGPYALLYDNGGQYQIYQTGNATSTNAWHHFAFVRQGGVLCIAVDGIWETGLTSQHTMVGLMGVIPTIHIGGFHGYGASTTAYIDEFRIFNGSTPFSIGINFTPPAAADRGVASNYDVYRADVGSLGLAGNVLSYVDATVPGPGTYQYNVAASDGSNDISAQSSPVYVTIPNPPTGPSGVNPGPPLLILDERVTSAYFGKVLNLVEYTYFPTRIDDNTSQDLGPNMIINQYVQQPTDVRQRGVDFTRFLLPGEVITSVVLASVTSVAGVTPLSVTNLILDPAGAKFAYTVTGGQDGIQYLVKFVVTTTIQTQNVSETFGIYIQVQDPFP